MHRDIILDFTGIYERENLHKNFSGTWVSLKDVYSCRGMVSREAGKIIAGRIGKPSLGGIHFLDSGDYHYMTKFFTDQIRQRFTLILIDHHTDLFKPRFPGVLTCGSWAREVLRENRYLDKLIIIGTDSLEVERDYGRLSPKIITVSEKEIQENKGRKKLEKVLSEESPIYISLDKDILKEETVQTNWNQGQMDLKTLRQIFGYLLETYEVLGVDICGEDPEVFDTETIENNAYVNRLLYRKINNKIRA